LLIQFVFELFTRFSHRGASAVKRMCNYSLSYLATGILQGDGIVRSPQVLWKLVFFGFDLSPQHRKGLLQPTSICLLTGFPILLLFYSLINQLKSETFQLQANNGRTAKEVANNLRNSLPSPL